MAAPRRAWLVFGFSTEEAAGEPGPGPGPRRLESGPEGIRRVWPAWSYVVVETGAGLEVRSAGLRRRLPPGWTEALPSETHLVLRGPAAARAWPRAAALRGALRGAAAWSRALPPPGPRRPPPLPLLPGGFATPRPPFFGALPGGVRARRLALGQEHVVALGAAGEVYAWGGGRHGQLGHGTLESELQPRLVEALAGVPMQAVAAGGWHSASVSETGDLYVWGWNESGQLALPSKALAEERAQDEDPGADAELTPHQEQLAAEDTAFISIQAFPALLDLPQDLEVSKEVASSTPGAGVNTGSWDTRTMPAPTSHAALSTWWPRGCGQRRWYVGPGPPTSVCWSHEGPKAPRCPPAVCSEEDTGKLCSCMPAARTSPSTTLPSEMGQAMPQDRIWPGLAHRELNSHTGTGLAPDPAQAAAVQVLKTTNGKAEHIYYIYFSLLYITSTLLLITLHLLYYFHYIYITTTVMAVVVLPVVYKRLSRSQPQLKAMPNPPQLQGHTGGAVSHPTDTQTAAAI
ncbi:RCC1 domain-containing protein 1 isoform X3 [Aquila chrysaetos chrysaetos]|uniref:RCC1 domain-containing protein 1 isoform X3 n=1 Tax=Aquila chrysaetos chrysaetos TaxID=223781 RepID=UPI00117720DF|nr:RCC1 domain-containing protein 1 isoform X3 [Aquila chrysaetos chrysaetos]